MADGSSSCAGQRSDENSGVGPRNLTVALEPAAKLDAAQAGPQTASPGVSLQRFYPACAPTLQEMVGDPGGPAADGWEIRDACRRDRFVNRRAGRGW